MLYRKGLLTKLVLVSLLVAGLSAPLLAQPGPGDKDRRRNDGSVYGWDVANGRWRWFSHVELVDMARGFSHRRVYWYGMPYGWTQGKAEWKKPYVDKREPRYIDNRGLKPGRGNEGKAKGKEPHKNRVKDEGKNQGRGKGRG